MPVVVVESPAKARTIEKYLGPGYRVLASYGHVRDLPARDGSVDPERGFAMQWEVAPESRRHIKAIADALKEDDALILATDPDREGEAISWHLTEALTERRAIRRSTAVSRVVFNAITRTAVTEAMKAPRAVDAALVEAYLARRALDYLVGFKLSPVLWRKLPGARSAGRVQSVCLRLIVEREMEIEAFRAREYWTVSALLATPEGQTYPARLTVLGGRKLDKFDIRDAAAAEIAVQAITSRTFAVTSVDSRPVQRNPSPPFMTSTLQQEASRKFGMGARQTMQAAQRLYEAGHITYMRTDGIDMAPEAVMAARAAVGAFFGAEYVPDSPRMYKNRAKNAQEAHECIRPTDMFARPESLQLADPDQRRLYELIWKRTLACQMAPARLERTTVEVGSADGQVGLRATGQVVLFDGFLRVYEEGRDDPGPGDDGEEAGRLPRIAAGEPAEVRAVTPEQHFTQPPPRYTEATLVKRMEELGIGRPSTYATIVTTIQEREYVRKEKNRLIPEDKGRLVTAFLVTYFRRYVEYDFTADLEEQLDDISAGARHWKDVLERFWRDFRAALAETADLRIGEVLEKIDAVLAPHLYPPRPDGSDPRACPSCGKGRLSLRTARSGGAFIGCSNYPACRYTRPLSAPGGDERGSADRVLGMDAGTPILLRAGRFGPYVQRGEAPPGQPKPPRVSLPKGWDPAALTLERALALLALPRIVGPHPADGAPVEAGIGRYGPYVRHGATYASLADADEVFTIGMNRAVEVLAAKAAGGGVARRARAAAEPLAVLGEHPEGGAVLLMPGRYGPYVKWGSVNASLPTGTSPETMTLEAALALIAARAGRGATARKGARARTAAAADALPPPAAADAATAASEARGGVRRGRGAQAAAGDEPPGAEPVRAGLAGARAATRAVETAAETRGGPGTRSPRGRRGSVRRG
jgi:DNA topoisomerase-1